MKMTTGKALGLLALTVAGASTPALVTWWRKGGQQRKSPRPVPTVTSAAQLVPLSTATARPAPIATPAAQPAPLAKSGAQAVLVAADPAEMQRAAQEAAALLGKGFDWLNASRKYLREGNAAAAAEYLDRASNAHQEGLAPASRSGDRGTHVRAGAETLARELQAHREALASALPR